MDNINKFIREAFEGKDYRVNNIIYNIFQNHIKYLYVIKFNR